jgi:hypothetical protein
MVVVYEIFDEDGACVASEYSLGEAKAVAVRHYESQEDEPGVYELVAQVIGYCQDTDEEFISEVVLDYHVENDEYDGGRWDYNNSRGI